MSGGPLVAFLQLLRRWWAVDRIRVRPAHTQLFFMGAGVLFSVAGQPQRVSGRRISDGWLVYTCASGKSLWILPNPTGAPPRIRWGGPEAEDLRADEIQVWTAATRTAM